MDKLHTMQHEMNYGRKDDEAVSSMAGWVSVSDLEQFIYETRDDSESFETEQDQLVAYGINQAMSGLKRLITEKKGEKQ